MTQRPAIRSRTSRSASRADSRAKRSASSPRAAHRLAEQDARDRERLLHQRARCRPSSPGAAVVMRLRSAPTRRVSQTNSGSTARLKTARRQSSRAIAATVASTVVTFGTIEVAVLVTTVLHAADVVGDPRLDLAGARAGEERQREPLQVAVDRRAKVVHDALADDVGQPGLGDAEHARDHRDRDHAADEQREQAACRPAGSPCRAPRAGGTARPSRPALRRDQRADGGETGPVRAEETGDAHT